MAEVKKKGKKRRNAVKTPDEIKSVASEILAEAGLNNGKADTKLTITNQEAYDEAIRIKEGPLFNEKKMVTTSLGKTFSLGVMSHHFAQYIMDLPEEEQNKLKILKTTYMKLLTKANNLMKKAYDSPYVNGKGEISSEHFKNKLDVKRLEIIELFGRMFSVREVHEICLKEWGLKCSASLIGEYRETNKEEIALRIEEHKRTFSDIRLGHKRSRLEELSYLYQKRKRIYEMTQKGEDHRLLLETLKQIKSEAEGDLIRIDANIDMNIQNQINVHLQTEVFQHISIKEIVLARVATRLGASVPEFLSIMNKGYYNNMIHKHADEIDYEEINTFPSTEVYDFDKINRMHQKKEAEEQNKPKEVLQISASDAEASDSIKELLMKRILAQKQSINTKKNTLQGYFIDKENQ
jgi:hypothetical protein